MSLSSEPAQHSVDSRPGPTRTSALGLSIAFFIGAFALGTSENVVSGILPQLARGLSVSEGTAGQLVSVYAATVVVAGPILTLVLQGVKARRVVFSALVLYLLGSLLAAASSSFAIMVLSRLITGLVHTTLMVVFLTTALKLAPEGKQASAAARITMGLSVATVLGVPVGVLVAQHLNWRFAFLLIAALAAASLVLIAVFFPRDLHSDAAEADRRASLKAMGRPKVFLGILATALTAMAALTLVVYVVPFLTESVGVSSGSVAAIMFIYGLASVLGNSLGGRIANRDLGLALAVTITATMISLSLLVALPDRGLLTVALVVLLGAAYFSTFPPLNTWIAKAAEDVSPTLALAFNSSAFNVGIALAGWIGGLVLNCGIPEERLPAVAIVPAVIATAVAYLLYSKNRHNASKN